MFENVSRRGGSSCVWGCKQEGRRTQQEGFVVMGDLSKKQGWWGDALAAGVSPSPPSSCKPAHEQQQGLARQPKKPQPPCAE